MEIYVDAENANIGVHTPHKTSSRVPLTPLAVRPNNISLPSRSASKKSSKSSSAKPSSSSSSAAAAAAAAAASAAALSKANGRASSLGKQLAQATQLQAAAEAKAKALTSTLAEQQESRVEFERETNRVLGLYNELQKEGKELYHAYSSKAAKVKALSEHVTSLEEQLLAAEQTNQTLAAAVKAEESKSATLSDDNAELTALLDAFAADRSVAEHRTQMAAAKLEELEAALSEQEDERHNRVASAAALSDANAALQEQVESLTVDMDRLEQALEESSANCQALTHRLTTELVDRGLATASAMVYELKAQESYDESMERLRSRLAAPLFLDAAGNADADADAGAGAGAEANATTTLVTRKAAAGGLQDFTTLTGSRDSIESWGSWGGSIADDAEAKVTAEISVQTSPLAASKVLGHLATVSTSIATTNTAMAPIIVVDNYTPDRLRQLANSPATPLQRALPSIIVEHSTPSAVARKPAVHEAGTSPMAPLASTANSCTSPMPETTPVKMSSNETMTSPRSPAADFMALAQGGSPQTLLHQIESVTISNELLREHHAHLSSEVVKKDEKISVLEAGMKEASAALDRANAAKANAEAAIAEAEEQFMFNQEEMTMLHSDAVEKLTAAIEEKDVELGDVSLEFAELSESVAAIQARADQVTALSFDLDHLRAELERSEAAAAGKEQAVAEALAAGQQGSEAAESLRAANTTLEAQVKAKVQECASLQADFEKQLKQQQAVNRNLSDDLRMVYNKNKAAIADLMEQFKHDDYKGRYTALLSENQRLRATVEHVQGCFAELQATSQLQEHAAAELSAVYARVVEKLARVEVARGTDHAEMARLRKEHASIVAANKQVDEACRDLVAEKEVVAAEHAALKDHCGLLRSEKAGFEQQLEEMGVSLAEMQLSADELESLREVHASLVAELDDAREQAESVQSRNALVLAELGSVQASQATLTAELDAAREEMVAARSTAEAQLAAVTAKSATLGTQLETTKNKYNELSEFVEEERMIRSDLIEEMEKDMVASQEEADQLKVALAERTQMVEACKEELDAAVTHAESELAAAMGEVYAAREQGDAYKLAGAQEAQQESEAIVAELRADLERKMGIIEELGGELCSKELAIVEVEQSAEKLKSTLEENAAKERNTMQASFLKYKEQSEQKIAILRDNLSKAEAEVTFLDTELTKIQG